jgi:hypothetical protein
MEQSPYREPKVSALPLVLYTFLRVGFGLLLRSIRVFADLGDALVGRLNVDDETFFVGRLKRFTNPQGRVPQSWSQ